ncbi:MAG TPA: GH92 family glycosyl hydrolase, partial [Puia sp.]|nr:GH92 family glycosyl hydrolase [Puia sp.]
LPKPDKVDLVEPRVDAANSRFFFFSSACRPFGMVNLNPDMVLSGTWGSGYRYNEDTIKCFSHIHCWELSGIPVLPTTGVFKGQLGPDHYGSSYSHDDEVVHPGYHKVVLKDYGVTAELTSTMRVGFHRYTFPASRESDILFDFTTVLGSSQTDSAVVRKVSSRGLEGHVVMAATTRRPKPITVYFVVDFDKAFDHFGGWKDGRVIAAADSVAGRHTGVYVRFPTGRGEVRQMKVAISYVSVEEARHNMLSELPDWDFQRVVKDSRREWNEWLGRIDVEGGTLTERRRFYTDLWHALQGRRVVNDVSGSYIDMTGVRPRVGHIPKGKNGRLLFNHYNSDSYWGAQWSLNTLWDLVYPEVTESFINSMLMMYDDGGLIPRGPSGGNYTYVMTGATTTPFIVSAYMKGIRGFDIQKAYEGMRKDHFPGGMMSKAGYEFNTSSGGGIEDYMRLGYVPWPLSDKKYGLHQDGSAQTLEYAYQDYALAQMAGVLGKKEDHALFMRRAENYRNIFDKDIGWMWTKTREGRWNEPVDILLYEHGWVEGNAAQYTWFVPHDVPGLIGLMGGNAVFTERLNSSFEKSRAYGFVSGDAKDRGGIDNRRVYINYGNQPCMETPFLFNYSGAPWLTQYWCRQVIDSVYSGISPQKGYGGDEDQGLMGALSVLLKIGLFSTNGGVSQKPFYEISSPLFNKITLHLNRAYYPGGSFVIEARGNGPGHFYIKDAVLNGRPLDKPWVYHSELVKGGKLVLSMGVEPNKQWGSDAAAAPPGMSSEGMGQSVKGGAGPMSRPGAGDEMEVRPGALKEAPVHYVDAFSNEGHPEVAYWFFDQKMLARDRYRGKIDSLASYSKYTLVFLTSRGTDFYDTVLMHPVFEDLVAYAHSKGLKIGLQIWKDDRGVLPENTNRLIQEGEVLLDDHGKARYDVHAEGCRDPKTIFKSEVFKIYAFQKLGSDTGMRAGKVESPGGWYKDGTLKDITGKATVQADTDEVKLTIHGGRKLKGYTAYIMTQHYYMSCSNFSDQAKEILTRVFEAYKDIPFDGVALDEYKGLRIARPPALVNGVFRDRLYMAGMGERLRDIMGMPAERALFDMRYAPVGQPEVRIRAIDEYMRLLRTATLDVERTMYETGKRLYGKDCFIGVHNTFHNNLDEDEVWQTGVSWWNIRRDYGHTDEETSTPIQLGIGMCYPMNAMYNMYYNKSLDRIWTKALYDLRYGIRTHYHAANDIQGWGVSIDAPAALEKINRVENGARLMNRFNPSFPGIRLLVVYGMPAQCNWWPDAGQRGRYDVNDRLHLEGKCVELWKNGVLNVAAPTDVIEDGRLALNAAGKPVLNGYVFDAVVFLYPQYSLPKVTAFFRRYVEGGGRLLIEGPATHDFYGKDMTAEWKGIAEKAVATSFSLENVLRLGTGKNDLTEGVLNEDGSYTFTSPGSLATDRPAVFSFTKGGHRLSGVYKGVAVIRVDGDGGLQKLAATGFSSLSRDGEEVLRLSREADIFFSEGRVTVADAGHSVKAYAAE